MERRNTNDFAIWDAYRSRLESLAAARQPIAPTTPSFVTESDHSGSSDPRNHFTSFAQLVWLDAIHSIRNATNLELNRQLDLSYSREINTFERGSGFRPSWIAIHNFGIRLQQDSMFYYNYFPQERLYPQLPEIMDDGWMPDTGEDGQMIVPEFDENGEVIVFEDMQEFSLEDVAEEHGSPGFHEGADHSLMPHNNESRPLIEPEFDEEDQVMIAQVQEYPPPEFPEFDDNGWIPDFDENGSIIMPEFDEEIQGEGGGAGVENEELDLEGKDFETTVNEYEVEDFYSQT